jgi:hypothetical protein
MRTPRTPTTIRKPSQTLWDGEAGTTCPVFPFYRHPVFRRLKSICYGWMPGLFVLALVLGRLDLAGWLIVLYLLFLLGVVALLGIVTQHGKLAGSARAVHRLARGWRFLCPACTRFGPERFACGACGAEVEEFVLLTHGLYLNNCPACKARVFRDDSHTARARCAHCTARCDARYHQRQVRVFGVLDGASLQRLRQWPLVGQQATDGTYLRGDDGRQLTYVLDLGDPPGVEAVFGPSHAVRAVETLWLGEAWHDPLSLAQALDRFIRRAQLSPTAQHALPIWVRDAQWDAVTRNILEARFPKVEYGVSAETFLARSTRVPVPPAATAPQPSPEGAASPAR